MKVLLLTNKLYSGRFVFYGFLHFDKLQREQFKKKLYTVNEVNFSAHL